jgi:hypothetical protein
MFAMVVWGGFRVKEEGKGGRGVQDDTPPPPRPTVHCMCG